MTRVAAFDAGKEGALALYDSDAGTVAVSDLPLDAGRDLDAAAVLETLLDWGPSVVAVEDCWRPKTLVLMCGEIAALAKVAGAAVRRVHVGTWKNAMLGRNTNDKNVSRQRCRELAPDADLRRPGARTDSADRAEAVLLALYAARTP